MRLRRPQPASPEQPARLTLLLSSTGWRDGGFVDQLPRLLDPMGIRSIRVLSGEEAEAVIRSVPIHIAVLDLQMPLHSDEPRDAGGGARTLQLLRRLQQPPPTVVVRPPQPAVREHVRGLQCALREGAFAVLDRPVQMETMLEVMRRILRRHYAGGWPTDPASC